MDGFYRPRTLLKNTTPPQREQAPEVKDRKFVFLILDALREDFVEFDDASLKHTKLKADRPGAYKGKKLQVFKELKE